MVKHPTQRTLYRNFLMGMMSLIGGLSLPIATDRLVGQAYAETSSQGVITDNGFGRFRGVNGTGHYPAIGLDLRDGLANAIRVELPGSGNGSPVVHNGVAYIQSADNSDATRFLTAIRLGDGATVWQKSFKSQTHPLHKFSSYASSTPCVDSSGVYILWADLNHTFLSAWDHAGNELWTRDFGPYISEHGFGTSPIRVDDKVIFLNSQDVDEADVSESAPKVADRLVAVSVVNGETKWECLLPASKVCYGVPCVWDGPNGKQLIGSTTKQGIFGVDVETGELMWNHPCFKQRVCSSPLLHEDVVVSTHGSGGGRDNLVIAFDLKTAKERFRFQRSAPYVPSPVAKDDALYLWGDAGVLTAVSFIDGRVLWTKRIGGDFSSSPIIVGDAVLNVSVNGTLHLVKTAESFEKLAEYETELTVRSTPVVASDALLIRGDEQLLIIKTTKP